jgi:glucose-6-phosphate isomerase
MIKFDFSTYNKIDDFTSYGEKLKSLNEFFDKHKEMMGWFDLDKLCNEEILYKIREKSLYIRENCDIFLVIGIGGSYMGSQAVIDALNPYFYNDNAKPKVIFVGTSLSTEYLNSILEQIDNKDIIINVISKSGNTLETLATYDILLSKMKEKYSLEELKKRIIVTTEASMNNDLYNETKQNGFEIIDTFKNIGGRFSVFTEGGLLPICVSGINVENLINGAKEAMKDLNNQARYAIIRDIMISKGKLIEAYTSYEPKLYFFLEWIKQLYGESLGKNNKGVLPISIINTRDLHSLGQYIQEGPKNIYETLFVINNTKNKLYLERYSKNLSELNDIAYKAVSKAHFDDEIYSNIFEITELNESNMGYLLQFFMVSVTISGLLESNEEIFNQNGVEKYKTILNAMIKK